MKEKLALMSTSSRAHVFIKLCDSSCRIMLQLYVSNSKFMITTWIECLGICHWHDSIKNNDPWISSRGHELKWRNGKGKERIGGGEKMRKMLQNVSFLLPPLPQTPNPILSGTLIFLIPSLKCHFDLTVFKFIPGFRNSSNSITPLLIPFNSHNSQVS